LGCYFKIKKKMIKYFLIFTIVQLIIESPMNSVDCLFMGQTCLLCHKDAIYTRTVEGEGFHRSLVTNILLRKSQKPKRHDLTQCSLLIVEKFPSNVYIDIDELNSDIYFPSRYGVLLKESVNTEKPEYNSKPFEVYIYLNTYNNIQCSNGANETYDCQISFRMPFHIRYHAAAKVPYTTFDLTDEPKLFGAPSCEEKKVKVDNLFVAPCSKLSFNYISEVSFSVKT
jgi:hypothetical protein